MATNPMQRRSRNSFLLGMLLTTIILGGVIAGLVYFMMQMQAKQKELQAADVYVLKKDISSGEEIKQSDLEKKQVAKELKPSNAVTFDSFVDKDNPNVEKKVIAKVTLKKGTTVGTDMLYADGNEMGKDVRKQEYNTIVLPMDLTTGNYVDIRLMLPSGQDFIVVSKKKAEIPTVGGTDSKDTIMLEMSEDEILTMSNAIVEAYMINGSKLYATKYADAGNQEAAKPTYPVNGEVAKLIESDENILTEALNALRSRYNRDVRENYINPTISSQEDAKGNEQTKMQQSITNSQSTREEYLQSLNGGATSTSK